MKRCWSLPLFALALVVGCGGGGGGTSASNSPDPAPSLTPVGSAKFTVDVATGEVKVENLSGSRASFGGNSLSFTSSTLLREGSPERRVLRVTAKNNTTEPIGANGQFKVLFSGFQNQNSLVTDLRSSVRTTTYWGTGVNSNLVGSLTGSTIGLPKEIAYDALTGSVFALSNGMLYRANEGTTASIAFAGEGVAAMNGYIAVSSGTQIWLRDAGGTRFLRLLGGASGTENGDFTAARFQTIRGLSFRSIVDENEFELFVADGTKVRRVVISPSQPNGQVTDFVNAATDVFGVAAREDRVAYSSNHAIYLYNGSSGTLIGVPGLPAHQDGISPRFNTPRQLAWIGENLFVADSANNRVRQIVRRPGGLIYAGSSYWTYTLSGSSTAGSTDGTGNMTHNSPIGIAAGPGESLFVSDNLGHRIRKITPISGRFTSDFFDGSANPNDLAQLSNPHGYVPSQPTRNPYILEDGTIWGNDSFNLKDWQFTLPEGLKSFSFIVTVEAEVEAPGILPSMSNTGTGTRGSINVTVRGLAGSGTGYLDGSASAAAFNAPTDLTMTADGSVYVADYKNDALRRITTDGRVVTIAGGNSVGTQDGTGVTAGIYRPTAVASNPQGTEIFFLQEDHVLRVAVQTPSTDPDLRTSWTIHTLAGQAGVQGNVLGNGTSARFRSPLGLAYVSPTSLIIADTDNHCLKTVSKVGVNYSTSAYMVSHLSGSTAGASGFANSSDPTAVRYSFPISVDMTVNGQILVADSVNHRIRLVTTAGAASTFSGSGTAGYQDATSALAARFDGPYGIASTVGGYAYVSDNSNGMIRRLSQSGVVTTVAGWFGITTGADGTGNDSSFIDIKGICVSPSGDLYVIDTSRIRLLQRLITN